MMGTYNGLFLLQVITSFATPPQTAKTVISVMVNILNGLIENINHALIMQLQ